mmetsp:Transcript_16543/g.25750  ORF Transcript_16543/g.25750 Transcript_16543/m.25750 type:complete len:172 (-) Transcript_16543:164-679(-)
MTIKDGGKQTVETEEVAAAVASPDIYSQEPEIPFVSATPVDQSPPEVMATPVKPSSLPVQSSAVSPNSAPQVVVQPQTIITTVTTMPVGGGPPGAPAGGRWATVKRLGPATWTTCVVVSAITCLCCCLPCGLWAMLCPCDQENAYISTDGRVYSRNGEFLGNSRNMNVRYH